MKTKKRLRKQGALERLEAQLKSGVKTSKSTFDVKVPLTVGEVSRINKEIDSLKKSLSKTSS
jgi:hypothetical protein